MSEYSKSIACVLNESQEDRKVVIRICGTNNVLVEFGKLELNIEYRVRVYWFEQILRDMCVEGLLEISPGVRSVLITYNGLKLPFQRLIAVIRMAEKNIDEYMDRPIPSRTLTLPLAFHDKKCLEYIAKYQRSVRSEAPYLPDNMEFVARCNGLANIQEVQDYVLATEQLVLGLGDVYLGAPCAVPLDPRYRLNAPKYNPARTMTPEGAVGIGGSFMCMYPMESPGGYQLIGRTVPFWDTWQINDAFKEAPWLLRPFDRIQFKAVSEEEIDRMGAGVHDNTYRFEISEGEFRLPQYQEFLQSIQQETDAFRAQQARCIVDATKGY